MKLILASQSPRRIELLRKVKLDAEVIPANIDESTKEGELPVDLVQRLATQKAEAVANQDVDPEAFIIASDTIVWDAQERLLGKPKDEADAKKMLSALSGHAHNVSTGVCILSPVIEYTQKRVARVFEETTLVHFRQLSNAEIDAYIKSGEPMDKAGAYGIQGLGRLLVHTVVGSYDNVVGLPVERVVRELAALAGEHLISEILAGKGLDSSI